ncbi:MAG: hypothetical protein KIS67_22260 [Verrucomicrobiae bacterium]|nr:hypothetical protein [Verrucomicrobiae bacterium]
MDTTTTPAAPFSSVQEFIEESGFGLWLQRQTFETRIKNAFRQAGFSRSRMEHVECHRLTVAVGRSTNDMDFRPVRRIRADLRQSFRREGLPISSAMLTVYRSGSRTLAHVGILESASSARS